MLNSLSHQGNANQSYIEILFHPCQNGYHKESKQQQMLVRMEKKGALYTVGGNVN
jgi:hypothetical protein